MEHRVEGRSLSDPRPDDQFRCTAPAGFSDSRILCLQWVVGLGTGPAQAPLSRGCERQQTSMPSGSGLLPGPTLRAPRARWDLGHWYGWTIPVVVLSSTGLSSAEYGWPPLVVTWGRRLGVAESCHVAQHRSRVRSGGGCCSRRHLLGHRVEQVCIAYRGQ